MQDNDMMSLEATLRFLGGDKPIHYSTLYRGIAAGRYPKPIHIGPNTVGARRMRGGKKEDDGGARRVLRSISTQGTEGIETEECRGGAVMTPEDPAPAIADGEPAEAADVKRTGRRRRGPKDISPSTGARNLKSAAHEERVRSEDTGQPETPEHELRDGENVAQDEQREVERKSESEAERVFGYRLHPLAALFPRCTDEELHALAENIRKNGQRHDHRAAPRQFNP